MTFYNFTRQDSGFSAFIYDMYRHHNKITWWHQNLSDILEATALMLP